MTATTPTLYSLCGLRVRSQIEMPLPAADGTAFDVEVVCGDDVDDTDEPPPGEQIAVFETPGPPWYVATRTDDGFLLRFRECGEFQISAELDRISVHADRRGRHDILPVLLTGTVVSFLLALRGATVLHASAVSIDGRALAFVGQSGRGKSTMATLLCLDGAALVTDDVLVISDDGPLRCLGGSAELRLRDAAARSLRERTDVVTRNTEDDRLAYAPPDRAEGPLPLAGIVVPSPSREHDEVQIRPLDPATALFTILAFPRIHGWSDAGVLSRDLATIGRLVNEIPVYEAIIPWGPPFSPQIAEEMRGLLERR